MRRVFLTSIPKSGTHLLLAFLESIGVVRHPVDDAKYRGSWGEWVRLDRTFGSLANKVEMEQLRAVAASGRRQLIAALAEAPPGALVTHHYPFDAELCEALRELDYVVLFMIRDPRDQLISYRNHVLREPAHKNYARFIRLDTQQTFRDLLLGAPTGPDGESNVTPVVELYRQFERWLDAEGVRTIDFRSLVGAKGNGLRLRQLYEADRLCALIEPEQSVDIDECLRTMFNEKHSLFVRGQIDVWRDEFSAETKDLFDRECATALRPFLGRMEEDFPPGWGDYVLQPHHLRRAWWLAERDLAEALAARAEARGDVRRLELMLARVEADSRARLELIHRLNRRLCELEVRGNPPMTEPTEAGSCQPCR